VVKIATSPSCKTLAATLPTKKPMIRIFNSLKEGNLFFFGLTGEKKKKNKYQT